LLKTKKNTIYSQYFKYLKALNKLGHSEEKSPRNIIFGYL